MTIRPRQAWTFARLLIGESVNGEAQDLTGPYRSMADYLAKVKPDKPARGKARKEALAAVRGDLWEAMLAARPDRDELVKAVADVNPLEPAPETDETPDRCATLADLRRLVADTRWPWPGWLAAGVLNALAADPGTGKTIMAADLARRLWFGLPWPDGQPATFPEKTRTLWVPGDRTFGQLLDLARAYGLPDEAMLLNASPSDPTAGLDLDDPDELAALSARVRADLPGLVFVDTVGMTTAKNLCKPEDARDYFGPLMDMSHGTGVPFLMMTHLSRDGQALGRRISGACRLVWKMTHPDPEGQPDRRRVWVDKTYTEKPPALGMTIADAGCSFDFNPPADAPIPRGGRPPEKIGKAMAFLTEALSGGDRRLIDLINEWEKAGENKGTFFNASKAMEADGRLVIDDTVKPKVCHLVKAPVNGHEPAF